MPLTSALNLRELQHYLSRVGDRWPLQMVMLGGARVADLRRGGRGRESGRDLPEPDLLEPDLRDAEYVVVLVSDGFDGLPWLERVYQATALWDALEMGAGADIHCYTAAEFLRRRESTPLVREVVAHGLLLYEDSQPFSAASAG